MAQNNLDRSLALIFGHEGGYSSIKSDPGNWTGGKVGVGKLKGTKYGIAAHSYPTLDIKNLTLAKAAEIYRRDYAKPIRFDELPAGVDHSVLDFAINSGVGRAIKHLQLAVGVKVDGKIGDQTMAAVNSTSVPIIVDRIYDSRMTFLRGLPTWGTFGKGWTTRVARVRLESLKMFQGVAPAPSMPPDVEPIDPPESTSKAAGIAGIIGLAVAGVGAFLHWIGIL